MEYTLHGKERIRTGRGSERVYTLGSKGRRRSRIGKELMQVACSREESPEAALPSSKHIREWPKRGAALLWLTVEAQALIEWGGPYIFFQLRIVTLQALLSRLILVHSS